MPAAANDAVHQSFFMQRSLRRLATPLAWLLVLLLFLPPQLASGQGGSGVLAGNVVDPTGARISGATLQFVGKGSKRTATTDGVGHFSVRLQAGGYRLTVTAKGFLPLGRDAPVAVGSHTDLSLTLEINAEATEVNVNSTDAGGTGEADNLTALILSGRRLETLSDDDTTFQQQVQAIAGGGDPGQTQVIVDGFSGASFPPKTAIREIRINSNPFSAEYDAIGFGRIEIFTRPGTSKLHGAFELSGTDQSFNARNPYDLGTQPPYHDLYYNGNLSGPLGRATSFFLAAERTDQQNDAVVDAVTLNAGNQAAQTSEAVPNPLTGTTVSARIDRQVTATNVLTGRYEWDSSGQTNSGVGQLVLPSEGITTDAEAQTLQLSDTQTVGAKTIVETRFEYVRNRTGQTPDSTAPSVIVEGSFSGGGSGSQAASDHADHYELQEYISHVIGPHFLRLGGRFRDNREANTSTGGYNGAFTFPSLAAYQQTVDGGAPAASQFNVTIGTPSAEVSTADLSVYAEDEWKLRKGLTLDYGFRAESQTAIPDHFDPAPRLGVAYAVTPGKHKEPIAVLRSGFGMFYNRFAVSNLLTAVRQNGVSQLAYLVQNPSFFCTTPACVQTALAGLLASQPTEPTIYRVSPDLHAAYAMTGSFSVEHGFSNDKGVISATYIATRGVHQYLSENINAPLPGTYNPDVADSGVRPLGGTQNIYQFVSEGVRHGQTLSAAADLNPTKALSVWAFYTLQFRESDTGGATSFPSNQYDLAADYGRTTATRQRLFSGLWYNFPRSFMGGLFFRTNSGVPFNITTGTDLNGDTIFNDRPSFATDLTRPSVVRTRYGNFDTAPITGQIVIPINYAISPAFASLQVSAAKEFHFGPRPAPEAPAHGQPAAEGRPDPRYQLRFSVEAANVLNHNNPGVPVGVLSSPFFGQSVSLASSSSISAANRTVTLHTNFSF